MSTSKGKTIYFILIFFLIFNSCNRNTGTVNIGMQTQLLTSADNIVPQSDRIQDFFIDHLQLSEFPHYPGKTFSLPDTVYTSTVEHFPYKSLSEFVPDSAKIFKESHVSGNVSSIFFRSNPEFIYRTVIPEEDFKQAILLDMAGTDSSKIAGFFNRQFIKDFLVK